MRRGSRGAATTREARGTRGTQRLDTKAVNTRLGSNEQVRTVPDVAVADLAITTVNGLAGSLGRVREVVRVELDTRLCWQMIFACQRSFASNECAQRRTVRVKGDLETALVASKGGEGSSNGCVDDGLDDVEGRSSGKAGGDDGDVAREKVE